MGGVCEGGVGVGVRGVGSGRRVVRHLGEARSVKGSGVEQLRIARRNLNSVSEIGSERKWNVRFI